MKSNVRISTAVLVFSLLISFVPPSYAYSSSQNQDCSIDGFSISWSGPGADVIDICLTAVSPQASDGSVKLDFSITNKKAITYNLSFEPSANVSAILVTNGKDLFEILKQSAQKFNTQTAFFPFIGNSTIRLRASFSPDSHLSINLSKLGDNGEHAVGLVSLGLASVFTKIFGGIDIGKVVSQDPNSGIDFAAELLAKLNNVGFDLVGFTMKLYTGDVKGALGSLAKAVEDAPEVWASLLGISSDLIKQTAQTVGNLLKIITATTFLSDLIYAPGSGGLTVIRSAPAPTPTPILLSDTFYLDTKSSNAKSNITLINGQSYSVRITGTFSLWDDNTWKKGACSGTPEGSPMYPSQGVVNGPAGNDAIFFFAVPRGYDAATPQWCAWKLPSDADYIEFNTDDIKFYKLGPINSTYNKSHQYEYRIYGKGKPLKIMLTDSNYSDNRGRLKIEITPLK
jgi:hypothetical protein